MAIMSAFYRFIAKYSKAPVTTHRTTLNSWRNEVTRMPTRQVEKIELCTAHTCGKNEWGDSVDGYDTHTFLQLFLEPTADLSREVILIERVESSEGIYHSVVPLPDYLVANLAGTLRRPDIIDCVCVIRLGSAFNVVRNLNVERTLHFNGDMSVQDLVIIIDLVSSMTRLGRAGGDCEDLARSFAFYCLAALAPALPPPMPDAPPAYEIMFEAPAKRLMDQLPLVACDDAESRTVVQLIQTKREEKIRC